MFGPQESFIENTGIGQRIPMSRRTAVFVVQVEAQAGSKSTKHVRFDEPNTNERSPVREPKGGL